MIAVIDYGMGNLGSILNMLKKIGAAATVTSDPLAIREASGLILPGVGAFDVAMQRLNGSGLRDVLDDVVLNEKKTVLGICLGMQLLTEGSEEGDLAGLGWVKGVTRKFRFAEGESLLKVPHMGWNSVRVCEGKRLVMSLPEPSRFYFVHSYHVVLRDGGDAATWTDYGYGFVSAIEREHIMGTQFHPEKSHHFGMSLLRNFCSIVQSGRNSGD